MQYLQSYANRKTPKVREQGKQNDKTETMLCKVFSGNIEAVKHAAFLMASTIYFKTKLCCHNYTVYE